MGYECSHSLSSPEVLRYSRQIIVEEIGPEGQQCLRDSSLLVIGAGALGSPVLLYCAAAGIGRLGIVDSAENLSESLRHEIIHRRSTIGSPKAMSALSAIKRLSSRTAVQAYNVKLDVDNAREIIERYGYVANCSNDLATRQIVSETCAMLKKPLVCGIVGTDGGQISVHTYPKNSKCDRCSFAESSKASDDKEVKPSNRVVGPVFGIIGSMMAVEVLKVAASIGCWDQSAWNSSHCETCEAGRYSRKIPLETFCLKSTDNLRNCSLLIVGGGGLGSPLALYCAAAGIGKIGIVDHDTISIDNLHRQIIHEESDVGTSKGLSVERAIQSLDADICVSVHQVHLDSSNAKEIIDDYDIVADCSDNAPTRYLVSDACAIRKIRKPLVSGSALGWDGQLTVYNHKKEQLCYRCLHPQPPPPACATNCSDNGVIGPVVGVIGSMQALEVLKIAAEYPSSYVGKLFVYDGLNGCSRDIVLRNQRRDCAVCGEVPTISSLQNYVSFCNSNLSDKACSVNLLRPHERLTAQDSYELLAHDDNLKPLLIDTRSPHQFRIGHLRNAVNFPFDDLVKLDALQILICLGTTVDDLRQRKVIVICRRGNNSQLAVLKLREKFTELPNSTFKDIVGGYTSWHEDVDTSFPIY